MVPKYYQSLDGEMDVLDVMNQFGIEEGLKMQALQYIFRAGKKPGESEKSDLLKAIAFLRRRIENIESAEVVSLQRQFIEGEE